MSSRTRRATLGLAAAVTAIAVPFTLVSAAHAGPPRSYQCLEGPRVSSVTIDGDVNPATVGTGCTAIQDGRGMMLFSSNPVPFYCEGVIAVEGAAAGRECHSAD
ncbi:hypothetical protein [Streptosporangium lutulentum]|uniref:Secreted protein n=1 Tax=Streptosporangium lutulentum TaxID=1461250 RepID=A0ABT9QGA1_9ACTN|nr:hypothetical protein [Streptosporangium lutulentum]MDP9845714.1 hypothetical protein [Streptosporangium lutulentum]